MLNGFPASPVTYCELQNIVTAFFVPPLGGKHCLPERRKTRVIDLRYSAGCHDILQSSARVGRCFALMAEAVPQSREAFQVSASVIRHQKYPGPTRRSIRFLMGGCVEKRLENISRPVNGWQINMCAMEGDTCMGTRLDHSSIFLSARAKP